jgi:D-sedoheptulose 7-phosphate isomerase
MNVEGFLAAELSEHSRVLEATGEAIRQSFVRVVEACSASLRNGGQLLFFGNGGSAADAQHLATELVVRYRVNRRPMRAIALTTDTSALTAIGNDFGFDDVFARQVEALCRQGDVALGFSTSGNSENVLRGLRSARALGAVTVGFGGGTGGRMRDEVDHLLTVPTTATARIQEMHILLGHTLCAWLESDAISQLKS